MLLAIPALHSLPGASKSLFLDFDGDFQPVWNRTDSGQTYLEVTARPPNLSEADIRKVWETVAEDFAPFKVDVTTVEPASFANNVGLRVVIAGEMSAHLVTGPASTVVTFGDRFITDDNGATLLDTSGYASINSFTNDQPNVVYVFAGYLQTWSNFSSEGHSRSLAALIANTASHEAGHSFGLPHHSGVDASGQPSDYHVGSSITTPIMGNNTAGDRTLWSSYTAGSTTYDSLAHLRSLLGARTDDHPSGSWFARALTFGPTRSTASVATVRGVIEQASDSDWFKFSTTGSGFQFSVRTVERANLDVRFELYKTTQTADGPVATRIAAVDPPILAGSPFSGLGASYSTNLAAGDYLVAIKSHGGYGVLGNYTLTVSRNSSIAVGGVIDGGAIAARTSSTGAAAASSATATQSSGGNGKNQTDARRLAAIDALFRDWS